MWIPVLFFVLYTIAFLLETTLIVLRQFIPLLIISITYPVIFFGLHLQAAGRPFFSLEQLMLWLLCLIAAKVIAGAICTITGARKLKSVPADAEESLSFKTVTKLWLHLGIYDIAQMVFRSVDKLIVSLIASKEALAIYYNGSQDIPFLPVFLASIRSASLIQLSYAGGKAKDAVNISRKAAAILSTVAFAALTYVLCFRYEIIVTLFSEKYIAALPVFICSIMIIPAQFCCPVFFILQNKQQGSIINRGAMLDMALAVLLMLPLYNLWGPVGITVSIVIAAYCQTGYYLYHAAKVLRVSMLSLMPVKDWLQKLVLFGGINIAVHYMSARYMAPLYALITGGVLTGSMVLWLLLKEYRVMNNNRMTKEVINDTQL